MNIVKRIEDTAKSLQDSAAIMLAVGLLDEEHVRTMVLQAIYEGMDLGMEIGTEVWKKALCSDLAVVAANRAIEQVEKEAV